ncbi:MAG: class I SAM-dependent methyltransferase [Flavobacteriales bacterium]|nr:class I SAM-dependent methyltransferase [Flavobacteriales bacterium]
MGNDKNTAESFASSWNNLPQGSVYTREQVVDWFDPITDENFKNKQVLELGCGNGSLLTHIINWHPEKLTGVDLGESVQSCEENMRNSGFKNYEVIKGDLTTYKGDKEYDIVYCIGVLHHMQNPYSGFESVLRNTKSGGKFHCWVYAKEGNFVIRFVVDPIRKIATLLPWWITKFLIATPLSFIYFLYAHFIVITRLSFLPLYEYSQWITKRDFPFFRHVAFDQLVTPQTTYIPKSTIDKWLNDSNEVDKDSTYTIFRNGNSWKFGGVKI